MKCKKVERWIIEYADGNLPIDKSSKIKQHIKACQRCKHFKENLQFLRMDLQQISFPQSSDRLIQQVRLLCQYEIESMYQKNDFKTVHQSHLPKLLLIGVVLLMVLTGLWSIPLLNQLFIDGTYTFQTTLAFTVLLQNSIMLLFSPLLFIKKPWKYHFIRSI